MRLPRFALACPLMASLLILIPGCKQHLTRPVLDPGSLTILCLGDSITAGTHGDGDDGQLSYPGILASILQPMRPTIQVINEGQNGWAVDDVAQHVSEWLVPTAPNIILLQIGTNDLEQGEAPDEAARRLNLLLTEIQNLAPTSHLYVASCTKVRSDNRPRLALSTLEEFNILVPRVVKDHDARDRTIVFVDLFKRADFTGSDLGPDGEHPNDSGYQKIAEYWSWELQRHEMKLLH